MEGDKVKWPSIPKSSSFSPKITRPKLPPFAGLSSRSISPRSKTDPGRGEIKSIMEDIMNLKKTDWKTFSRSRTSTLPKGRSVSTNTSPNASPCLGSPVGTDDSKSGFSRDRSRSLKLLTDRLLNKKPKQTMVPKSSVDSECKDLVVSRTDEQWTPQVVPESGQGAGSHLRRSPDRKSMERTHDNILESPEDVEQEEREVTKSVSSDESFRTVPVRMQNVSQTAQEVSPDSDYPQGAHDILYDSDGGGSSRSQDESPNVKSPTEKSDDEGLSEGGEHGTPFVSTYIYHPIPRNSKFLQLAATKPPKRFPPERRSGVTTISSHGRVRSLNKSREDDCKSPEGHLSDDQQCKIFQCPNDSERYISDKSSPPTTHPSYTNVLKSEASSSDTNVLKSEASSSDMNGFSVLQLTTDSDDEQKHSHLPFESQLAGEMSDDPSYHDTLERVVIDTSIDFSERKNGKSTKHKSKSDPCGDRAKDVLDFPQGIDNPQSQSAPLLSKEELEATSVEKSLRTPDEDRQKFRSENTLCSQFNVHEDTEDGHSSTGEEDYGVSGERKNSDRSTPEGEAVLSPMFRFPSSPTVSAPVTPHCPPSSPVLSNDRQPNLLNVPISSGPGRKTNIFRSASSASVFQARKPTGSAIRDKTIVRKYSITSDEAMINSKSSANLVPDFLPIGDTANASSMPAVWHKDRILSSTDSPEREPGFVKDKRYHIVEELYKNEKEYVEALRTLKDKYMVPLKTQSSVDDNIVDNIFYMIPEILTHHSIYLDFLDNAWKHWDTSRSTVGNIVATIFAKQTVLESYMSFVENYKASGKVIEHALTTKSSVQKFIEQCQRDSGSKLTMKDLIVRPIQRIPRYELLMQRLLDNTPRDHPDHALLQDACRVMHELAVKIGTINDSQHEEDMQETLKKLELLLITDLAVPDRAYIRHDMVQFFNKKDQCCIWLFSDVVIISSIKRKNGPVTRKVSIILKTPLGQDFAENIKHKVWLRVGLDDLEIVKTQGTLTRKPTVDKEHLEEDMTIVTQMSELAGKLSCQHQGLDETLKDISQILSKHLSEAIARSASLDSNKMELLVTTQEGVLHLVIGFSSADKKALWETAFTEAKQKLSLLSDKRAPEFLQPLQITKTRAGMQFSCAAPIDGINSSGFRDVWVCNSDGYVGHMCLLSLQPEPIVTLNTPVPGCNARILCICAVPAFVAAFRRRASQKGLRGHRESLIGTSVSERPRINVERAEEEYDSTDLSDSVTNADTVNETITASVTTTSTEDNDADDNFNEEGYQSESDSSDDEPVTFITRTNELYVEDPQSDDEDPKSKVSENTENSPDPITTFGNWDQDPCKSTMWLGTEDGCIHIFQSCDNIKTTKNKLKIQHGSPVHCIIYLDNKVFVSLLNGDLVVYKRDQDGLWDTDCPYTRTIGSPTSPITKMLAVAGKLWCGCKNQIHVINPLAFNVETSFHVLPDTTRTVQCLVSSGQGVWVASQQSSKVMLFHAVTYEFLLEVSIAQAVSQKLQSADDIIRQHKAACLRITSLMVCKDLLWVGTSAGVILTIPIPRITSTSTRGCLAMPAVTGLVYGHTGHVRFLTSVEISSTTPPKLDVSRDNPAELSGGFSVHDMHRRSSMAATTATMASRVLVISGGDGYEDFRSSATNEGAGRDDSTNHLLLWQV